MAVFVLIHGSFHGGWCWRKLVPYLRAAGHDVYTPTLTGLGERAHLATPQVDLETHVRDILSVLESEELVDAILCAHSYGGMVARCVASRRDVPVAKLVYVDALVPDDGESVMDLVEPQWVEVFRASARDHGNGWQVPPASGEVYGISDPEDLAWVTRRFVPQPLATYEQAARLDRGCHCPQVYIRCEGFSEASMDARLSRLRTDPMWRVTALGTGHDAMITDPAGLATLVLEEAA